MARSAAANTPSGPRRPSWTGVIAGVVGAAVATVVGRATGAGWLPTVGLALLLGAALYLWGSAASASADKDKVWADLGQGIMVGVIVAIALLAVQSDAEDRLREAEATRQKAAERENLQLSLTMQTDLREIALANRDLHGFFLARKHFEGADLHGANLAGADLRRSRFNETYLLGANLDRARMQRADLRGALMSPLDADLAGAASPSSLRPTSLRRAQLGGAKLRHTGLLGVDFTRAMLNGADLRNTTSGISEGERTTTFRNGLLIHADFRGALMESADLRGAKLSGARFCHVEGLRKVKLDGATYDANTRWPPDFNPSNHGAVRVATDFTQEFTTLDELMDLFEHGQFPPCRG